MGDNKQSHALVAPRIVAAVGLVALGAGLGMGLMLAKTYILVGFLLSITSVLGVVWIYFQHLRAVYRSIERKEIYNGPSAKELAVAVLIIFVIGPLSVLLYLNASNSETDVFENRALMQFSKFIVLPYGNTKNGYFNISLVNEGGLEVTNFVARVRGKHVTGGKWLPEEEENSIMLELLNQVKQGIRSSNQNTIMSGKGVMFTLKLNDNDAMVLSDKEIASVDDGRSLLYAFAVMAYQDSRTVESDSWWVLEFCGYNTAKQVFWHYCGGNHNRVYRVTSLQLQ